ncbi:unnamed protein product [Phytophthora fragariaefolia]|uniref:Unnamed protein product n=1 Tax=Phytophthora fragariaefolia TaxID=1490495 RepID=A0A9W7CMF5_9STRA|nr:unnamed protein product [Phytophthora fragariaefolia]
MCATGCNAGLRLRGLHYHIEHIAGDANVWADIVSRWHVREAESLSVAAVRTRGHHVVPVKELSALRPMMDANFVFPTLGDIVEAQSTAGRERARLPVDLLEEDGVLVADGRPWVPTGAKDLLARIFVVAHCGSQGHRGQEAMSFALKDWFFIVKLEDKIAQFIRQCLLCKHFKGSRLIPRPYGPLLTPTKRNEVVHWDFLSLGDSYGDSAYLLVGSHFWNEMINHLAARLKIEPKFSPVYSPWLNSTVERFNRDVLQVLRALLLEYALDSHDWPYLLPAIQANLNHTPVRSLAGHSPVEGFTRLPASSALDVVVAPATEAVDERVIKLGGMGGHLERLRTSLQEMHREVVDSKMKKRLLDMQAHKVNFDVGNFVLWSRIDQRQPNHKLLGQWVGPFKVVQD